MVAPGLQYANKEGRLRGKIPAQAIFRIAATARLSKIPRGLGPDVQLKSGCLKNYGKSILTDIVPNTPKVSLKEESVTSIWLRHELPLESNSALGFRFRCDSAPQAGCKRSS